MISEKFNKENILALPPETEITVTVTTTNSDDEVYFHVKKHEDLRKFTANGDNTYTINFTTNSEPVVEEKHGGNGNHPPKPRKPHNIGIDVMSNGTINNADANYDSYGWGIQYRIQ